MRGGEGRGARVLRAGVSPRRHEGHEVWEWVWGEGVGAGRGSGCGERVGGGWLGEDWVVFKIVLVLVLVIDHVR